MKRLAILCALAAGAALGKPILHTDFPAGARVILHDSSGPCQGNALLAEHVPAEGTTTNGCYVKRGPFIFINWFDGDADRVFEERFKEFEGS